MNARLLVCLGMFGLLGMCQTTRAELTEVPLIGRWEDLAYSATEVHHLTRLRYDEALAGYKAQHQLDDDHAIKRRVSSITATLIAQAIAIKPVAKNWAWEVHTTSDPTVDAYSMAGGKLVIGSAFVKKLNLGDGELAMLISHEIAHVVAEHHREELFEARRITGRPMNTPEVMLAQLDADFSLQIHLEKLSSQQESEADQLGMIMANRAGWASCDMVSFYRKLGTVDTRSMLGGAYPSSASRLSMAIGMARLFDGRRERNGR